MDINEPHITLYADGRQTGRMDDGTIIDYDPRRATNLVGDATLTRELLDVFFDAHRKADKLQSSPLVLRAKPVEAVSAITTEEGVDCKVWSVSDEVWSLPIPWLEAADQQDCCGDAGDCNVPNDCCGTTGGSPLPQASVRSVQPQPGGSGPTYCPWGHVQGMPVDVSAVPPEPDEQPTQSPEPQDKKIKFREWF